MWGFLMKKAKKFLLSILSILTVGFCAFGVSGCKEAEKGEQGVGVEGVSVDEDGKLIITLTDGTTLDGIELPTAKACEHDVSSWKIFQQGQTVTNCETALFYGECKDCGEITFKKGAKHRFGFGKGIQEPTCISEGYEYQQCSVCGYTQKTNETEAFGHEWGEWQEYSIASCEWSGQKVRYCTREYCHGSEYETVEALGHDEQDIVVEPTCSTVGYTQHGCIRCEYNRLQDAYVSALGHTVENGECTRCQRKESTGLVFALVGDTYTLSSIGTCTDSDILIPEKHNGIAVTAIGYGAFQERENITSVTIQNTVTSIGECAFTRCADLTSITIPNSVTNIEGGAFAYCRNLATIKIPEGITSINVDTFSGSGLTNLIIPDSVTSIGQGAFAFCDSLTGVTLPNSVTNIGDSAFYSCSSLTSITIPDSVTSIGRSAFYNTAYYNDESNWENGVFYLSGWLLSTKLTEVNGEYTVRAGTKGIADCAFDYCKYLTDVIISDSVVSIGDYAFDYCANLKTVTIGKGVISIGEHALSIRNNNLTSVIFEDTTTWYCSGSFEGAIDVNNASENVNHFKSPLELTRFWYKL